LIALVGFMGSGKTTVGRALAGLMGLPFADIDSLIEKREGKTIADIFGTGGEETFRAVETEVALEVLAGPDAVVALGGGAPTVDAIRDALSDTSVVYLQTSYENVMQRVGDGTGRPMLAGRDARGLFEARRPVYESVADVTVSTDGRTPEVVAKEIADRLAGGLIVDPERVRVELGTRSYDVVVGRGLIHRVGELMPRVAHAERAFVLSHPELRMYSDPAARSLEEAGLEATLLEVPEGESSKTIETAARLLGDLADAPAHRHDLVVSVGGGVLSDLAGFVASTYARGVPVLHVATSLLGQVDAAIGGKTGVNLPQGKNLVGTVHQPVQVICDIAALDTLPEVELTSGMAEVIKYGFIRDPEMLDLVSVRRDEILRRDPQVLEELVLRSARAKAEVVAADEFEQGGRAALNYGHTFAHALEQASGYSGLRHGEAVALGMMAAAYLAEELGRIDGKAVELHRRSLEAVGLPVAASLKIEDLESAWMRDKKYKEGVRFVLLRDIGVVETGIKVDREVVVRALGRMDG
jgi:shikimate kinase / 3-dehydroquinate synthase